MPRLTPEGKVKAFVDRILKLYKIWFFKPVQMGYGKHGIPDYICCIKGKAVFIETKSEDGKITILQERTMREILLADGIYLLVKPSDLIHFERVIQELIA